MKKIPLDHLQEKTNLGMQVKRLLPSETFDEKAKALGVHRDDHYIFLYLLQGEGYLSVDLNDIKISAGQLYYVLPGQVHEHIRARDAEGWFLAVDRFLVPPEERSVFEGRLTLQQPVAVRSECNQLMRLMEGRTSVRVLHALVRSFLAIAAEAFDEEGENPKTRSRAVEISRQFKRQMTDNIRTLKTPAAYARLLHITPSYLNEAIRTVTGLPVSHWIKQEILVEAKRLLYHSDLSVKEVAAELGYEDAAYFSRFFRGAAGMSAQAFRAVYRK
ncbi:MAG TPA: helix-turn-helix domain-containing protein [Dinghuibacter sp.]|uniref:helix-turn-helix domain-containing protein n=1 Tax=Dinghuibacter sp. TaxID=2024697 RepID=UPI002CBA41B0|nr:helix-turn-helix domain-containing protein [Dinghuibacter sp.]HTJ11311.1 helix-turn-helix domain-containing protein [Dinghuibacter sp.]